MKQMTVGVADAKVGSGNDVVIVTYALGSCLGITFYDAVRHIGGLLHIMLPNSADHPTNQNRRDMFVDTGVADILTRLRQAGADTRTLEVKVFGGAKVTSADQYFTIGQKNINAFQDLSQRMGLRVTVWQVGGTMNRTIRLFLKDGKVALKTPAQAEAWL
jgi:chemotaxis protein CheD